MVHNYLKSRNESSCIDVVSTSPAGSNTGASRTKLSNAQGWPPQKVVVFGCHESNPSCCTRFSGRSPSTWLRQWALWTLAGHTQYIRLRVRQTHRHRSPAGWSMRLSITKRIVPCQRGSRFSRWSKNCKHANMIKQYQT